MKTRNDDPKMTAYLLGELAPSQRQAFERELARNPELRAALDDMRKTVSFLVAALQAEPCPELTPEQRRWIAAGREAKPGFSRRGLVWARNGWRAVRQHWVMSGLSTASVTALLTLFFWQQTPVSEWPKLPALPLARNEKKAQGDPQKKREEEAIYIETTKPGVLLDGYVHEKDFYQLADKNKDAKAPAASSLLNSDRVAQDSISPDAGMDRLKSTKSRTRGESSHDEPGAPAPLRMIYGYPTALAEPVTGNSLPAGMPAPTPVPGTESYAAREENAFQTVTASPLSTFSVDVDTASYSNLRRFIFGGQLPPPEAVRVEEMLNYFPYDYPAAPADQPFSVHLDAMPAPWAPEHELVRIGLHGREIELAKRPVTNLVFLIDVSGSMNEPNKLPWVRQSLKMLLPALRRQDHVAIVVYAGESGVALPGTSGGEKSKIIDAIDRLHADGSTNGAAGLQLAYQTAAQFFNREGINRIILATDGDFNVGVSSDNDLVKLIQEKARSGVFLSVLGFGMGNVKDSKMELLADKGNGHYAYIDSLDEARKVLVEQAAGTLVTIAKDVKIQVEFNPAQVSAYRLIGYEKRMLQAEDFNNDKKDAGEIGAGHTVTALYEVVPAGIAFGQPAVDPLKYQWPSNRWLSEKGNPEWCTVKLRYKAPAGEQSRLLEFPYRVDRTNEKISGDMKFAAAVAGFGLILRNSAFKEKITWNTVLQLAREGLGSDEEGYRAEFLTLVQKAKRLAQPQN